MKKDLVTLLIKEVCQGKICENCNFCKPVTGCYLTDIINIIKNYKKENDIYEK